MLAQRQPQRRLAERDSTHAEVSFGALPRPDLHNNTHTRAYPAPALTARRKCARVGEMSNSTSHTKDRRQHESWLHDALELPLFDRFQLGTGEGHVQALILHGQRSSDHPDFALLDANRKLILVELKVGEINTETGVNGVIEQVRKYVKKYRKLALGDIARWYCEHGVDVNTRFGYRGKDYVISRGKHDYGRLNRWVLDSLKRYREPCEGGDADALDILIEDYRCHVGEALEGATSDTRLEVDRCILIAQKWPEGYSPGEVEGVKTELWTYTAPGLWVQPNS